MNISETTKPDSWFTYRVRVQPHHTDYGGVVWHGTYIAWMESARVECLRAVGASLEGIVESGYDLPVIRLDLRYRQPLTLGMEAAIKTRLMPITGLRLVWEYAIETVEPSPRLCVSGQVTLVAVDVQGRKVLRRIPPKIRKMIAQVEAYFS